PPPRSTLVPYTTLFRSPKIIWADNIGYQKSVPVDFSNDFDEQPTPAQLKARAEQYIEDNNIGTLPTSITVSFVQLSQMSGYEDRSEEHTSELQSRFDLV